VDLIEYGRQALADLLGLDRSRPIEALAVAIGERVVFAARLATGDQVVVKVDVAQERLVKEVRALRAVAMAGVPVPAVLAVSADAAEPAAVAVLTRVAGEPLTSTNPDRDWRAVGAQLRRLHDLIPADGWPPFIPGAEHGWWARFRRWADEESGEAVAAAHLPGAIADVLHGRMSAAFDRDRDPDLRVLHGDCAAYHWLLDAGSVTAAVDFGDAGLGDPVWDLVVLTHWDEHRLPAVLDGYGASAAFRARVAGAHDGYRIIRHLAARSWLVEHGVDPAPTIAELVRLAGSAG
jgi:Ser/Thr protein kinase RdoA (MazF antagonist)